MVEGSRGLEPSEGIRRAFLPERGRWLAWGHNWRSSGGDLVLLAVPGQEIVGQELFRWWQESVEQGCDMLPAPVEGPVFQNGACWLAFDAPPRGKSIAGSRLTKKQRLRLAAELGRLQRQAAGWPAYLPEGAVEYWCRALQERLGELLLYRGIVRRRGCRTDIEGLFMENFEQCYQRGQEAVNHLLYIDRQQLEQSGKGWAFWGLSGKEVLWQEDKPYFYGIWPYCGLEMMDLSLLLKTLFSLKGERCGDLPGLIQAYCREKGPLSAADESSLQAQWLFPEGYWYYARQYFLRQEWPDQTAMKQEFHYWEASLLKEKRLLALFDRQWKKG